MTLWDGSRCRRGAKTAATTFWETSACRRSENRSPRGAVGEALIEGDDAHLAFVLLGHEDHTFAFDAADGEGLEVGQDADLLASHLLGRVVLGDDADDGPLVETRIDGQFNTGAGAVIVAAAGTVCGSVAEANGA